MDAKLVVFKDKQIRRTMHNGEWWFVVEDVVLALIDSNDPKQYIKRMRQRDSELGKGWVQIVHTLSVPTDGGPQPMLCANTEGLFRIIQSIPSQKAEPFKRWLAKVGYERMQEIADPSRSLDRARETWQKHGRSEKWIQQRMTGQETRNKLTDYWSAHDIKKGNEFATLTNIIHQEWAGLSVAELLSRQIAQSVEATGLAENKSAAKSGCHIAAQARQQ